MKRLIPFILLALPSLASAAFNPDPIGGYISSVLAFVNGYVIPLIIAAAILVFMYGMLQYFVIGASNEEQRAKGKQLIIWATIGLVLMLSLQGIVMLLTSTFGFGDSTIVAPSTLTI